jgi:hypothetical protein
MRQKMTELLFITFQVDHKFKKNKFYHKSYCMVYYQYNIQDEAKGERYVI